MFALYPRLRGMGVRGYEKSPDRVTPQLDRLSQPFGWKTPRQVFVCSMSDLFHREVADEILTQIFEVMERSSRSHGHIFQVLTKRPGRVAAWWDRFQDNFGRIWPENVWLGTSVEMQKYAPRLDVLERVPAPVKFVSAEPLLGPLELTKWLGSGAINWVIVGGESGRHARPMNARWVNAIQKQCDQSSVPFFFKQWGAFNEKGAHTGSKKENGRMLAGREWNAQPIHQPNLIRVPLGNA